MRKGETVMEYFARMKKITDGASAGLTETFAAEQVTVMKNMLAGITLEAFKRGLTDELAYPVTLGEPETLEDTMKIAQRIELMMKGKDQRATINMVNGRTTKEIV